MICTKIAPKKDIPKPINLSDVKSIIKELIMAQGHATYKSKIDNTLLFSAVKTRPLTSKKQKKIIINN